MRIAIDARPLISENPSGIGIYLIEILKNIDLQDGNEYFLYTNEPLKNNNPILKKFNTRVIKGNVGTLVICFGLKKYLKIDKIDIFWGTEHMLPLFTKICKRVVTVHDLALIINPKWGSRKNAIMQNVFCKLSCKQADHIIAISESTKDDLKTILHIDEKKISVVYNGGTNRENTLLKPNEISAMETKFNVEKFKFFSYVGNIEPRKNISTIVQAFDEYCKTYNSSCKLVLAGKFTWRQAEIMNAIESSTYINNIILPGYISDREKQFLMSQSIAFLFPSNYEGFGIPIVEAFTYGSIVICTKNSSLPEVGGKYAIYVDNNQHSLFLAMVKSSSINVDEREEFIQRSKKWVKQFNWRTCGIKTIDTIEREIL